MDTEKKGKNLIYGTVMESLPNTQFRVLLDGEEEKLILAFLAGKMVHNRIRVVIGDKVALEIVDPQGEKGRIMRRM